MATFTVQASGSTAVAKNYPNTNYSDLTQYKLFAEPFTNHSGTYDGWDNILLKFREPGDEYKYKRITKVRLVIYAMPTAGTLGSWGSAYISAYGQGLVEPLEPDTVTYATQPKQYGNAGGNGSARWSELNQIVQAEAIFTMSLYKADGKKNIENGLRNGFSFSFSSGDSGRASEAVFYGAKSSYKPFLECEYSDDNVGLKTSDFAPASGAFVDRTKKNTFTWACENDTDLAQTCFAEIKQANATFEWRVKNAGTSKTINVPGTQTACTVPANTFPLGEIEWRVKVTANSGVETASAWQEVTTTDVTPTAKPVSPSGIVVDATIANRFSWQHIISTGTPQSKADLQWSADGTTWNTLATVTGENQYYDVPANTFASGTKYWRVRTYNTDGTASEWSDKAEFIAINAPSAPSIVIQSTGPRPKITWQTTEQEAYELTLSNGYASGTIYGTEKAWHAPVYLADGSYTVHVRVQNQYGMWSEWSAAALPVSHTEGEAITLTASTGYEAALAWQTTGSYDFYLIERDGEAIARTEQKEYIDHTSVGSVTYRVRGCYADTDDYGLSNAQTVTVLPDTAMICDLDTGTWQRLPLSETILRTSRAYSTATIQTAHLAGLAYPVAERTEFRDLSIQLSCAFLRKDRAAALALEALTGRLVCVKTKQGDMAIGYLTALEKNADEIMSRYSFEIANIHWKEAVRLDP